MGLVADVLMPQRTVKLKLPTPSSSMVSGLSGSGYPGAARAYSGNEIVYAAVNLLSTSAAEPHVVGRLWPKTKRQARAAARLWQARGLPNHAGAKHVDAMLARTGYIEEIIEHPLIDLLNAPNPFMSRGNLWSTVVMHYYLAGNAYLLKARGDSMGNVMELWPLRPDRMKIVPDGSGLPGAVEAYEYKAGNDTVRIPAADIMHFKTRNPTDDYYGMPPLLPIMGRITIDGYMAAFLRKFFESGGAGPGAILTVKQRVNQDAKNEIRNRFRSQFGGLGGMFDLMILDAAESTYQQLGLNRGLRDALPKEIDAQNEARIAMAFGIPGSILGLLIGYESSSYANKRQDWQVLWDIVMTPLLSDFDDVLNLSLVPEFNGVDEVLFDLSDIRALQEDVDALQERTRKNWQAGLASHKESRLELGMPPEAEDGVYFLPSANNPVPVSQLGAEQSIAPTEPQAQALNGAQIASLLDVVTQVTEKLLSPETARIALKVAFPTLDEETIDDLVSSAEEFEPEPAPAQLASARALLLSPPRSALPGAARVSEARCPTCDKLGGRHILEGEPVWCRKCKKEFPAGGVVIEGEVVKATRKRIERDAEGRITAIVEEQV